MQSVFLATHTDGNLFKMTDFSVNECKKKESQH